MEPLFCSTSFHKRGAMIHMQLDFLFCMQESASEVDKCLFQHISTFYKASIHALHVHEKKNISGGARKAMLRSLDNTVSSLLALISREYA